MSQKTLRILNDAMEAHRRGDLAAAERGCRTVLKNNPNEPDALHVLGLILDQRGDTAKAIDFIGRAVKARPDFAVALATLGNLYAKTGNDKAAEQNYRQAVRYQPRFGVGHHNLGLLLLRNDKIDEAIAALRAAVAADPTSALAHVDLGGALRVAGDAEALLASASQGLQLHPRTAALYQQYAEANFALGRLAEGWRALRAYTEVPRIAVPVWNGEDLNGRGIVVWCNGGLGEQLLFAGMIPDVLQRAAKCVIHCPERLYTLFQRAFPTARVIAQTLTADDLADVHFQSTLSGLGAVLRTSFDQFPDRRGYLKADPDATALLRARYKNDAGENPFLIGIAWRSVGIEDAAGKNVGLGEWGPVLHVPGATFVNLQYGDSAAALDVVRKAFSAHIIEDATIDPLGDVDRYAAQVAALDLVVTSSNAVAHLAGALGVPTFCLLPKTLGHGRRWYWFAERGSSPWYPATRLFVQTEDKSWLRTLRDVGIAVLDAVSASGASIDAVTYLRGLAKGFDETGRFEDADVAYRRLSQEPGVSEEAITHYKRASMRKKLGDSLAALELYDLAIAADPKLWPALNEKGVLLNSLGRTAEAFAAYDAALAVKPDSPEVHNNIGTAVRKLGDSVKALEHYQAALALQPDNPSIGVNVAGTLDDIDRSEESLQAFARLIDRHPDFVDGHYTRSLINLSVGNLAEGWAEFDWRLKRPAANARYDLFPVPRWEGQSLAGKNIAIWTEQGLGDEMIVASMVGDAINVAKSVMLLCSERLIPLFRRSFPKATVVLRSQPFPEALTDGTVDYQMSLSDLGRIFRPSMADFPQRPQFLHADPALSARLRAKYRQLGAGQPVVGLSWNSNRNPEVGSIKGVGLLDLAPILKTPGVTFVNLQYGDCTVELAAAKEKLGVDIFQDTEVDPLTDMDAFAAQVAAMDLVITVSNTTVHTAGALGIPAWLLISHGRGRFWYWFRERPDSPWYSSVHILRRPTLGGWSSVIEAAAADLALWRPGAGPRVGKT